MKNKNSFDKDEIDMLISHCVERLPYLKEGLICDCMDELPTTLSFESPKFIIMIKVERKKGGIKDNG